MEIMKTAKIKTVLLIFDFFCVLRNRRCSSLVSDEGCDQLMGLNVMSMGELIKSDD